MKDAFECGEAGEYGAEGVADPVAETGGGEGCSGGVFGGSHFQAGGV